MVFGRLFPLLETVEFSHCDLVTVLSLVESAVIAFLGASDLGASDGATHAALGMHAATLTAAWVASCIVDCVAIWAACTVGLTFVTLRIRFGMPQRLSSLDYGITKYSHFCRTL
jgi:hypothetical protein